MESWKIGILKNYSRMEFWKNKFKKTRILEIWNFEELFKDGIMEIKFENWNFWKLFENECLENWNFEELFENVSFGN